MNLNLEGTKKGMGQNANPEREQAEEKIALILSLHVGVCVCVRECIGEVCVCELEVCQGACQPARLSWRAPAGGGGFRRAPCLHRPTGACWERGKEEEWSQRVKEGAWRERDRERA